MAFPWACNKLLEGLVLSFVGLTAVFVLHQQALPRPQVQDHASPAPDYGHLYQVVGSLFDSGGASNDENNHQKMIKQLEPNQRYTSFQTLSVLDESQCYFGPLTCSSLLVAHHHFICGGRESLLQMMNKLTGSLRSTCSTTEQLKRELSGQQPPQQVDYSRPLQMLEVSMPNTPPMLPHPLLPHSQLDHAASMPLMPSTVSLPMPQNLTDEPLPSLQPLPGSQGTALLQPPGQQAYPCLSQPCASALSADDDDSDPLQAARLAGSFGSISTLASNGASCEPPLQPPPGEACQLQQSEADANNIAEQVLSTEPEVPLVDEQLFRSQPPVCDELELSTMQPSLQLPKQDVLHGTPLDDCLAQLEDVTAPNMPELPDSEGCFLSAPAVLISAPYKLSGCGYRVAESW